ncbi:carbohydrate-binding protein [Streptomyces sp. 549]|uniref:carbohydrate-binding protein n=1 Tax=Streptomyces sp. 549 TaxID=3049076 RepID=UPI0024C448F6|nr:carbohydrate-binding protein [Streptomyces sp. 549]MDK1472461.1 carbohydrate-binding protein [Streptomyces sp. 549]
MTAGSNGTNTPEGGDDPFGYLYRSNDGAPAQAQQPGVPRTSYHQVRAVGERRNGPQQAQAVHQSPSPYYAAPEAQTGTPGGPATPAPPRGGRGQGPHRRNGLLIGALAVVAAVVIGVGAAVAFSGDDDKPDPSAAPTSGQQDAGSSSQEEPEPPKEGDGKDKPDESSELPSEDASSLRLDNGPEVSKDISGSKAKDGAYIAGFGQEGASATWTTEVPKAGKYRLYVSYSVPGKDSKMGLWVNDGQQPQNLNFKNFAKAGDGDWAKGWTYTYGEVNTHEGTNVFRISCGKGDACDVAVDRVWLAEMG